MEDSQTQQVRTHIDDEYAFAGVKDPKVVITTARDPSSRLAMFAKVCKQDTKSTCTLHLHVLYWRRPTLDTQGHAYMVCIDSLMY